MNRIKMFATSRKTWLGFVIILGVIATAVTLAALVGTALEMFRDKARLGFTFQSFGKTFWQYLRHPIDSWKGMPPAAGVNAPAPEVPQIRVTRPIGLMPSINDQSREANTVNRIKKTIVQLGANSGASGAPVKIFGVPR
jgi:hypothetical protein